MPLQRIGEQIFSKPWLITESAHSSIVRLYESKLAKSEGHFAFTANEDADSSAFYVQREPASLDVNGIGHLYVKGVIGQGLSKIVKSCGNTDTRDVQNELAALVAQGAKGILLCIDSPGGTVTGTKELADSIAAVAATIPVFVFSDSQLCSAAYWLAAGATRIITTGTAEVGSIGVYMPWIDRAAQWEAEGIKADPVINQQGTLKAIGFAPSLSDAHRAELQRQVDRIFGLFSDFILIHRTTDTSSVPESAMQGQVFLGLDALPNGLVDQLGSKEEAYEALLMEIDIEPAQEAETPADDSTAQETSNPI